MTFIAALRYDRIEAPWLLDGPINAERFRTYVEKVLGPTLLPGDLVIMDNLGSHKGPAIRHAIRAAGGRLFLLPKYSPDSEPDRAGLRQTQAPAAKRRRTHPIDRLHSHRQPASNLHRRGMRQLFQQLRLRANLNPSCSKPLIYHAFLGSQGDAYSHRGLKTSRAALAFGEP
jgi:hypothetical protein